MHRRRILLWVVILFFAWIVIRHINEIETLLQTLRTGQWSWILATLTLQLFVTLGRTFLFFVSMRLFGIHHRFRYLLALILGVNFINAMAPSGGMSGIALFIDDAKRNGKSVIKTAVSTLLATVSDFSAFCLFLLGGLIVLLRQNELQPYELITGLIMFFYAGGMVLLLLLGLKAPGWLERQLRRLQQAINHVGRWFKRPNWLADDWARTHAHEVAQSSHLMAAKPRLLLVTISIALIIHLLNLLSLYTIFLAFHLPTTASLIIAGYAMTILFTIISPTPNGMGVVEGLVPLIYGTMGLVPTDATLVTLVFRGITFWLPLLLGFVLLRRLHLFQETAVSNPSSNLLAGDPDPRSPV